MALFLLVVGLVVLVLGAELLVRGASRLAKALGISPLVVGLTVVAFGTSAPEMAVGVRSAADDRTELAVGNVVGSNIFNTLAILGIAAIITPLVVRQALVRREVPLVVVASLVVWLLALDGTIARVEGTALLAAMVVYAAWAIRTERREPAAVAEEYATELAHLATRSRWVDAGLVVAGLALLVLGSTWLVDGAVRIASSFGVPELVVGLTVVAAGTSMPELATSVVAGVRGERDIAVGNVVGSNLFNLLAVLGLSAIVAPEGLPAPATTVTVDLPVLVAAAALCAAVFFTDRAITRSEGLLFALLWVVYVVWLVLDAGSNPAADGLGTTVLFGVVPVVVVVIAWQVLQQATRRRSDLPRHP